MTHGILYLVLLLAAGMAGFALGFVLCSLFRMGASEEAERTPNEDRPE